MKRLEITPSQANYIKWIYRFSQQGPVRPAKLADKLNVKRSSVTKAVGSLIQKGLVLHEPFGNIRLTIEGTALGKAMARRNASLMELLVSVLGMAPEAAEQEVQSLEHMISNDVMVRLEVLAQFLTSSDAALKRLHFRIQNAQKDEKLTDPFQFTCQAHPQRYSHKNQDFIK